MPEACRLQLKFWGVRGSTPTPSIENLGYGGNTTCMEIRAGDERIIIDAGTGIRNLGQQLVSVGEQRDLHLFLTHFHWDHIHGLPFFVPLLQTGNKVHFHAFPDPEKTRERLEKQMTDPYFTLDFDAVGAMRTYTCNESEFQHGAIRISAFPLNHPQGACGYRVEANGAVIVIATDLEHGDEALDKVLRQNAEGADVLIYDAQYTPEEYATRAGWGHSHYGEGAKAARDAGVKRLLLFHHDPTHDDAQMTAIVEKARSLFENTAAARESELVTLV